MLKAGEMKGDAVMRKAIQTDLTYVLLELITLRALKQDCSAFNSEASLRLLVALPQKAFSLCRRIARMPLPLSLFFFS